MQHTEVRIYKIANLKLTIQNNMKLLALIITLLPAAAFGYECKSPEVFAKSVSADVVKIVESPSSDDTKEKQLKAMFDEIVDTERMAKFSLGKNYRNLKPEEQSEFKEVYHNFIMATYIPSFKKYNGEKVEVINTKTAGAGDVIVSTKILGKSGPETLINYRLARKGACYKVADIIAEGVSLINTQRQDFDSVISRKGYPELVTLLKSRSKSQ